MNQNDLERLAALELIAAPITVGNVTRSFIDEAPSPLAVELADLRRKRDVDDLIAAKLAEREKWIATTKATPPTRRLAVELTEIDDAMIVSGKNGLAAFGSRGGMLYRGTECFIPIVGFIVRHELEEFSPALDAMNLQLAERALSAGVPASSRLADRVREFGFGHVIPDAHRWDLRLVLGMTPTEIDELGRNVDGPALNRAGQFIDGVLSKRTLSRWFKREQAIAGQMARAQQFSPSDWYAPRTLLARRLARHLTQLGTTAELEWSWWQARVPVAVVTTTTTTTEATVAP
jgi:hypothetical protein